jgi:hypothetical protein
MTPDTHPRRGRRLGIFWFWGEGRKQSRFIGISRLWTHVATAEDKRCLEVSHEQGWRPVQTLSRRLEAFRFDHFPLADLNGTAPQINGVFTWIRSYCAVRSSRKLCSSNIRQNASAALTHIPHQKR